MPYFFELDWFINNVNDFNMKNKRILTLSFLFALRSDALESDSTLMACRPDSDDKFRVEGTRGNELRSCGWAARYNTEERCVIDIVSEKCPVACKVPCQQSQNSIVAGATSAEILEKEDTSNGNSTIGYAVTSCVLIVFALLIVTALVLEDQHIPLFKKIQLSTTRNFFYKLQLSTASEFFKKIQLFKKKNRYGAKGDDQQSRDASYADDDIEITISGNIITDNAESSNQIGTSESVDTQDVQEKSSCCDPSAPC